MKSFIATIVLACTVSLPALATDKPLSEALSAVDLVEAKSPITTISIDGKDIDVSITAWSDTLGGQNRFVGAADLGIYENSLTVTNRAGDGDDHYIDNGRYFDMVLFSFGEAVTLKGASFYSIDRNKVANGVNDVTVAGLSDNVFGLFQSGNNTWSDIAGKAISSGTYGIKGLQSTFDGLTSAKYWLVGAYNSVFSDDNYTSNLIGFKLSSLNIEAKGPSIEEPPTEVSEPGALALMSLGLGLVLYRRKRRA
ncbi:MAG: exosortase-dependent surface protein XDP1 [Alteromonas sp.]|jgi:hypothetical protein|uniref:exosortase-dependent surface protein XDP1 n=1 Tax=Alteromonas sp. TaxID=232 RepID=UPI0032D8DE03